MSGHLDRLRQAVAEKLDGVELVEAIPTGAGISATFRKSYRGINIECGQHAPPNVANAFSRMTTRAAAYFDRVQQEIDEDFDALEGHPPTLLGRMKPVGGWIHPKKENP